MTERRFNPKYGAVLALILLLAMAASWGARKLDLHWSRGTTLRLRTGALNTLDPASAADWNSLREIGRVYQSPLRYKRDPFVKQSSTRVLNARVLEPWLLERMPEVDQGRRRWTLHFKRGLRFHPSTLFRGADRRKGRELSACDWVESIRRHFEPQSRSPWKSYLLKRLKDADSLTCEGGDKAVVTLRFPDPEFGYFLAHPASSVLPVTEMRERNWDIPRRPVGSGAFRLERASSYRLGWRAMDAQAPVQRIEVDLSIDSSEDWKKLESKELDLAEVPESLLSKMIGVDGTLATDVRERGLELVKVARSDLLMVGISRVHPLLQKKRGIRLALGMAVNIEDLVGAVYGGRAVPAKGPLPPGLKGFRLDYGHLYRGSDSDRARDLLGSNGYLHGHGLPEFRLGCLSRTLERRICLSLQRSWGRVGIQTQIVEMTPAQREEAIRQGQIDLWPITWVADLPGAASFLEVFSGHPEGEDHGVVEISTVGKATPKLEALLQKVRSASGEGGFQRAVDETQSFLNLESPAVFLLHRFQYWLVRKGWEGVGLEDFSWHDSDQVSIKEQP